MFQSKNTFFLAILIRTLGGKPAAVQALSGGPPGSLAPLHLGEPCRGVQAGAGSGGAGLALPS